MTTWWASWQNTLSSLTAFSTFPSSFKKSANRIVPYDGKLSDDRENLVQPKGSLCECYWFWITIRRSRIILINALNFNARKLFKLWNSFASNAVKWPWIDKEEVPLSCRKSQPFAIGRYSKSSALIKDTTRAVGKPPEALWFGNETSTWRPYYGPFCNKRSWHCATWTANRRAQRNLWTSELIILSTRTGEFGGELAPAPRPNSYLSTFLTSNSSIKFQLLFSEFAVALHGASRNWKSGQQWATPNLQLH